ncbi:4Fe-4S dicluster domain-containing protein [Natranaerobius trueperi]|uniref:4Fe-4S ferredoxin-type domain-containing protein n=1 Tax=Natranaerobius trueperi TaxID=759412 RepID=A0A226C0Q0_9FIRM|nr:4Fe-4S dicluster domain-containing protein [Natranaerobius trueperi]OWZ83957.1 hypothetical protein CDO51_06115 [Natranaerobius trueperi]
MRKFETEVQKINHEIMSELTKLVLENKLLDEINGLPQKIISGNKARYRCCVYKERAIITERVRLDMGLSPNNDKDNTFLKDDYEKADHRVDKPVVQAMDKACDECPINRFTVTEACRGCVAHYCLESCPVDAISLINRQAFINQDKCIECGKCKKACPYNAISDVRRPCSTVCVVDAVKVNSDRKIHIEQDQCLSCGACIDGCPFGAIASKSNIISFLEDTAGGDKIHAIIAPSIVGQFGPKVEVSQIFEALKDLGMDSVHEAAKGADIVAYHEAKEFNSYIDELKFMMSSCCPVFVNLVKKFYPELASHLSTTVSPMVALGRKFRKEYPEDKIVFIGPCIAKKDEAVERELQDAIDYVLTFEEICAVFEGAGINPSDYDIEKDDTVVSRLGRNFAKSGGVGEAVKSTVTELDPSREVRITRCNGLEECKKVLDSIKKGGTDFNFIEGMGCQEGCIGGPGNLVRPHKLKNMLKKFGEESSYNSVVSVQENEMDLKLTRSHKE